MQINESAELITIKKIEIRAPIAVVWEIHSDINAWGSWHPHISYAELMGKLEIGAEFEWKANGYKLKSTIMEMKEHCLLKWQGVGLG